MSIIIRGETGWREEGCTGGPLRGSRMNEQIERWRTVRTDDWRRHPGVRRTVSINSPLLLFLFIMWVRNAGSSHPFSSFSFFTAYFFPSFLLHFIAYFNLLTIWLLLFILFWDYLPPGKQYFHIFCAALQKNQKRTQSASEKATFTPQWRNTGL